jgi:error-prone DNA polymerase
MTPVFPEPAFPELGTRSNFSFLEGASHPEEMVKAAKAVGLSGLGLADRNTVAGVVRAHLAAKEAGFAYRPGARLVFSDETPDILVYPVDRAAWGRLCRMLSAGNMRAEKGTCRLFEDDLLEWGEGLLLIILPPADQESDPLAALLARLKTRFRDAVYLGLSARYDGNDRLNFGWLSALAESCGVAPVALNEPFYHDVVRRPLADIVAAIRHRVKVADAGFLLAANAERHLKGPAEMARIFRDYPQAIGNAQSFFARLCFSLDELKYQYPDESFPGETPPETLRRLAWEGAAERYPDGVPEKVAAQIEHELTIIADLQYEPYFLTVRNLVTFARDKKILCQGRGSAANSTVCFCIGITEVNPNLTDLLFERFISPERREPPDIDVDFEHARRNEVIEYIYDRYGRNHAGLAAAVTTYRARSAGRETAKVLGLSEDVQSALSGAIWGWSTKELSEREARAAGLDIRDPLTRRVLDHASTLMSFPRHLTQHSGGFVITRDRLDEIVPIMPTAMDERTMVEWDKDDLDALSILKIDVLALGMLTCIAKAFKLLENHYERPLTLASMPKEQEFVYEMAGRADTIGVFQIESRAQMSMLPRLKPKEFYDLVIEVAIVRPGPIQGGMVHPYLKRRQGKEKVSYPKEELRAVLDRTLGVPLFQEQAMKIAIVAAGFTPAEADKLRRAMATFRRLGTIHEFRDKMVAGMVENGYETEFALRCFQQIEGFGDYGFPESHAASFALLVYASCWLKAKYPDVFCAALLNSQPMGFYAPGQLVRDAREHGVEVRPVDVNLSDWDSTLEEAAFDPRRIAPAHRSMVNVIETNRAVRLGFHQVKGLGEDDMKKLVENRGAGYPSIRALWLRSGLTRSTIERLADSDCFRSMGLERRQALWEARALDKKSAAEAMPLFEAAKGRAEAIDGIQAEPQVHLPKMRDSEHVVQDYRYLSLSLKAHPLSFLREKLSGMGVGTSERIKTSTNGKRLTGAGLVLVRQRPGTAKGVIFMTLEDETGVLNVIVWPKVFEQFRPVVMGARLVKVRGRLQSAEGITHLVAEHIEDISPLLGLLEANGADLESLARADEVRRPGVDQRDKRSEDYWRRGGSPDSEPLSGRGTGSPLPPALVPRHIPAADVMPKGRNFH